MARLEPNGGAAGAAEPPRKTSSLLQGVNASYLEHLLSAYEADPSSVGEDWRKFFASMDDGPRPGNGGGGNGGASWTRADWPPTQKSELISALDGD
ncbi:MAG TPA: hypothetical protein VED87_08110, partial [Methylocystis sp.]|nr:hypothetical protein [Methylocystis sp.]